MVAFNPEIEKRRWSAIEDSRGLGIKLQYRALGTFVWRTALDENGDDIILPFASNSDVCNAT